MSILAVSLAVLAAVLGLGALALGLARTARRADDWMGDVAWTTDPDYRARRGLDEEAEA